MQPRSIFWLLTILVLPVVAVIGQPTEQVQTPQAVETEPVPAEVPAEDLSWLPKYETGALSFLDEHPEADGRGTVVAIFDTGVDPGAVGLQTTPDGRPKVIDMIDGTGSGDVEMHDPVKPEEGTLTGLTGRTLHVPDEWKNPAGEYRLGIKRGYELFPPELISIVKPERENKFRRKQNLKRAQLAQKMEAWKAEHPKPDDEEKKELAELKAQVKLIDDLLDDYSDPGPIYDVVEFFDGDHHRVVVDTDEDGDLAEEAVLTNFRIEQQYDTFADPINMNFAANIYQDGKVVSLVCDTGAHGTHVAGIVAAYFPDHPDWNGVAPGAQIVSVKIGDTRLEGMETGPGLVRGLKAVLDNDCDLINMSYGEPTRTPNAGRVAELYSEVVTEHDVIFVSSAGNAGPALTTVGAPGGTTSAILGVGAYISPQMMRSEYSLREKLEGLPYTWTSRGPTADGDYGVDIFAPGGAIAPVPVWTRQVNMQMNGTSMASPNACGNIALLLSAAKQNEIAYNPASVRKAIQNTAETLEDVDVFSAGPGLIRVDRAWKSLQASAGQKSQKMTFDVKIPALKNARGIYLREPHQTRESASFRVYVTPEFPEGTPIEQRLDVNLYCELESTADWASSGDLLHLNHGGNRFEVFVDPTELDTGVHFAEVVARQKGTDEKNVLFRVPITVVVPLEDEAIANSGFDIEFTHQFQAGDLVRHYFDVPSGATWCEIEMTLIDTPEPKFFRLHTMQLVAGEDFEHRESGTYYQLAPDVETTHRFPVVEGHTLEVVLGQYWSILGDSLVDYEISFHGGEPNASTVVLATGQGTAEVTIENQLEPQSYAPSAKLTKWRRVHKPKSHEVSALPLDRDQLPDGSPVYELQLTYELELDAKTSITPRFLPWSDLLYDSQVGPFIYQIYDKNDRLITTNDMFADPVTLDKGTYRLVASVHHQDPKTLEEHKSLPLTIERSLPSAVELKVWSSPATFATETSGGTSGLLAKDESLTVYFAEPDLDSLPKGIETGDYLLGSASYVSDDDAAAEYHVTYFYSANETATSSSSGSSDDKKSLDEQLRAIKLAHLKTLDPTTEEFAKLRDELLEEDAADLQPLIIQFELLDSEDKRKERLEQIIEAADELIAKYNQDAIAGTLGRRQVEDNEELKKAYKEAEKQKNQLVDILYRKARAVAYRELDDVMAETPIEDPEQQDQDFQASLEALESWVDLSDEDYFLLTVREERRKGRYASAILKLNKQIDADAPFLFHKKRLDMLGQLEWTDWQAWQQTQMLIQFPKKQPPYDE